MSDAPLMEVTRGYVELALKETRDAQQAKLLRSWLEAQDDAATLMAGCERRDQRIAELEAECEQWAERVATLELDKQQACEWCSQSRQRAKQAERERDEARALLDRTMRELAKWGNEHRLSGELRADIRKAQGEETGDD